MTMYEEYQNRVRTLSAFPFTCCPFYSPTIFPISLTCNKKQQQGHHTVWGMKSSKLELREGLASDIDIPMQQSTATLCDLDQDLEQETAAITILSASSVNCDIELIAPIIHVRQTQSMPCELYRIAKMEAIVVKFSSTHHASNIDVTFNRSAPVDTVNYFDHDCSSVTSDI
jgi:hypothetical protein